MRVVVGSDFSNEALEAVHVALALADDPRDVFVAHAMPALAPPLLLADPWTTAPIATTPAPSVTPQMQDDVRSALSEWAPQGEPRVVTGAPAEALATLADEVHADVIALGATGRSAFERVLLGSTASALLHDSRRDVLIVRGHHERGAHPAFRRILVGASLHNLDMLARASRRLAPLEAAGARVLLAHARDATLRGRVDGPADAHEAARLLAAHNDRYFRGQARTLLGEGEAASVLRRLARAEKADLLVVGAHDAGRIARMLLGSTSSALAENAPCSVLRLAPGSA